MIDEARERPTLRRVFLISGFGNMVTCKWWDALWLNEAMATWLSFKPLVEHYSDWRMVRQNLFNKKK